MIVLICGSRDVAITIDDISKVFNKLGLSYNALYNLTGLNHEKHVDMIISGNANGPDKVAIEWASEHMCGWTKHNPEWDKYGRSAGIMRNKKMVEKCDVCIGFWNGKSRGTKFTLEYAKKNHRKTYVVDCIDGYIGTVHEYGKPEMVSEW